MVSGNDGFKKGVMQEICMKGGMLERRDAGKEGCRKGRIRERMDLGKDVFGK